MRYALMIFGFTTGNLIAAYLTGGDYLKALDRSFFQAIAISYVACILSYEARGE